MIKKYIQKNNFIHPLFILIGVLGFILMAFFIASQVSADGDLQYKASGFAYGAMDDNDDGVGDVGIGYISFGCEGDVGNACPDTTNSNFPSGYGVYLNADPNSPGYRYFSGYAWSSNYGWVSFNRTDVENVCGNPVQFPVNNIADFVLNNSGPTTISGWAKVLNPGPTGDGYWDGCIRFGSISNAGSQNATTVTAQSGSLVMGGWAWGSDVVGWISFDCEGCGVEFNAVNEILGCTISTAINYDQDATTNDGTCEFDENGDGDGTGGDNDTDIPQPGSSSDLALYIGSVNTSNAAIVGNTSYLLNVTDVISPQTVKLVPMAFNNPVESCTASVSATTPNSQALFSNWSGSLPINILNPGVASINFESTITNYAANQIYEYTINCVSTANGESLSASAFVTTQHPQASVSITANPNIIDITTNPGGNSTLSWTFSNVVQNSCEIEGFTEIEGDVVIPMNSAAYEFHNFTSTNPSSPGTDAISQVGNFPVAFRLTCQAFNGSFPQDSTYITNTELGCTQAMEDAGFCTNRVNPIFEEF